VNEFRHITRIRVRYAETDKMGVVYYGRYFEYFEQARTEMLRTLGLPYAALESTGVILPVIEASAQYRRGATYDDVLEIETIVRERPMVRIRIDYVVRKEGEAEVLAEGHTEHVFLNATTRRPVRIPPPLAALFDRIFS
jgi:acyl-CoA thioester hydrolase